MPGFHRLFRLAKPEPGDVGPLKFLLPRADRDLLQTHNRLRKVSQFTDQRCAGRRDQLAGSGRRSGRGIGCRQQIERGRSRQRNATVGGLGPAWAQRQRPGVESLDAQRLDPRTDADDVDDGVDGADLVEVYALHGHAMHGSLGLCQPGEDRDGFGFDRCGQIGLVDDGTNVAQMAMDMAFLRFDVDQRGAQWAAHHFLFMNTPIVVGQAHGGDHIVKFRDGPPGVNQATEKHVAGDPRGRIQKGDCGSRRVFGVVFMPI